jgi:hypothetical protein
MDIPFPGMDPYLEHPDYWPGIHNRLIVALANQLRPRIRPRYIAAIEERVYLERARRQRVPDIVLQKARDQGGGTAVAVAEADAPVIVQVMELEIPETYIELLDRRNNMKVVALIEVVSPSNKEAGPGRKSYRAKQRETLARECHFVEIDLLRRGRHVMSVPKSALEDLKPYDYLACVSRWPERNHFELYPRRLRERLPRVKVPLADPDPDVPLDVQAALEQVYEEGDYMLRLSYDQPCEPPLAAADQEWANERWAAYRAAHPELFS